MNADTDVDLFAWVFLSVVGTKLGLNVLGALHGMHDGGEIHQECIAHRFDNRTMMLTHRLLNALIMYVEQPQHAGFVAAHLAAKAYHVGEHDRG
jgi:hypothetical protein